MAVGNVILLNDGVVDALDVPIAVGLPTVGSVLYIFHVADVPRVPPVVANDKVPVVSAFHIDAKLGVNTVGFVLGVLTVITTLFEAVQLPSVTVQVNVVLPKGKPLTCVL